MSIMSTWLMDTALSLEKTSRQAGRDSSCRYQWKWGTRAVLGFLGKHQSFCQGERSRLRKSSISLHLQSYFRGFFPFIIARRVLIVTDTNHVAAIVWVWASNYATLYGVQFLRPHSSVPLTLITHAILLYNITKSALLSSKILGDAGWT